MCRTDEKFRERIHGGPPAEPGGARSEEAARLCDGGGTNTAAAPGCGTRAFDRRRARRIVPFERAGFRSDRSAGGAGASGNPEFYAAFPGTEYDESELTRRVAARCGTKHKEVALEGSAATERIDEVLRAMDQPSMDGVNTYFASWAAREVGLKVALSGLGGDELFAGYPTFGSVPKLERMAAVARILPGAMRRMTGGIVRGALASGMTRDGAAKAAAAWRDAERLPHAYFFARALFAPDDLKALTEPRFRPSSIGADGTTLEPTWMGWLQRAADEARRMGSVGAVS